MTGGPSAPPATRASRAAILRIASASPVTTINVAPR